MNGFGISPAPVSVRPGGQVSTDQEVSLGQVQGWRPFSVTVFSRYGRDLGHRRHREREYLEG